MKYLPIFIKIVKVIKTREAEKLQEPVRAKGDAITSCNDILDGTPG